MSFFRKIDAWTRTTWQGEKFESRYEISESKMAFVLASGFILMTTTFMLMFKVEYFWILPAGVFLYVLIRSVKQILKTKV